MKWILALSLGALLAGCATARTKPVAACCRASAPTLSVEATTQSIYALTSRWQDDAGHALTLSELRGQPVVISMFFATCEGVCMVTRDDLRGIEASLPMAQRDQVRFVLVSLDSKRDTVQALRAYRAQESLPAKRWRLLRGDADGTAQLAAALGIGFGRDASGRFVHASRIVVLDAAGKIIHSQDGLHADLEAAGQALTEALPQNAPPTVVAPLASTQVRPTFADSNVNRSETKLLNQ